MKSQSSLLLLLVLVTLVVAIEQQQQQQHVEQTRKRNARGPFWQKRMSERRSNVQQSNNQSKLSDRRNGAQQNSNQSKLGDRRNGAQQNSDQSKLGDKRNGVQQNNNNNQMKQRHPVRDPRLLSLFTLVRFDNNICVGLSGENGTCIAPSECGQRGGLSSGLCANGYGVCCIVTVTCGQSTFDNNTYFVNPSYPGNFDGTDSCQLTLLKSHPDVCQFRLDFVQFNIRGPETLNNLCTYDQFIVSGGNPVSPICGNNNGNHMYIDVGTGPTNPVTLSFVTSGSGFDRSWRVRIAQIPCSSIFRAEEGCMQYYTGVSGQIKSFNYDPNVGLQLSNQDYSICIRMERNFCGIQYMTCDDGASMSQTNPIPGPIPPMPSSFTLSGNTLSGQYAAMADRACQSDWLMVPCASNAGKLPGSQITCIDRLCGGAFNTEASVNSTSVISTCVSLMLWAAAGGFLPSLSKLMHANRYSPTTVITRSTVVTSTVKPFRLVFHTDGTEAPNDYGNRGFCLNYVQQPCTMKLR